MAIKLKRIYEKPEHSDGVRVLVDRIWPRGVAKDAAAIDLWLKEIAPSQELRKWFAHDPEKWGAFRERYFRELDANSAVVEALRRGMKNTKTATLLFAARDTGHNNAVALRDYLESRG